MNIYEKVEKEQKIVDRIGYSICIILMALSIFFTANCFRYYVDEDYNKRCHELANDPRASFCDPWILAIFDP